MRKWKRNSLKFSLYFHHRHFQKPDMHRSIAWGCYLVDLCLGMTLYISWNIRLNLHEKTMDSNSIHG